MRHTDGRRTILMDMTSMLSRPPSVLQRPVTTASPSSSSATPSSEREWKRLREPTLPTERLVSLTLTRPRSTLAFLRERSGMCPQRPATSLLMSKRRTRPSTMTGKQLTPTGSPPTRILPPNLRMLLTTTPRLPKKCSRRSLPPVPELKPPECLEPRSSTTLPSSSPTTFLDPLIFTDRAVTTSKTEETSELASTSPTPERTFTSESVNMPWDPSSTESPTTESSPPPDQLSWSLLITFVLPSVLLLLLNSTVSRTSSPMTLSVSVRMDPPINLLKPSLDFVLSPTLTSTVLEMPKRLSLPWSRLSPARKDQLL
mmetsp:Transcript_4139/g.5662  ORF Transcript_4139/g.5662 Transcript_4139/m.5662 type:complete len:314 (+) Transcript_4139:802-1743(+)